MPYREKWEPLRGGLRERATPAYLAFIAALCVGNQALGAWAWGAGRSEAVEACPAVPACSERCAVFGMSDAVTVENGWSHGGGCLCGDSASALFVSDLGSVRRERIR